MSHLKSLKKVICSVCFKAMSRCNVVMKTITCYFSHVVFISECKRERTSKQVQVFGLNKNIPINITCNSDITFEKFTQQSFKNAV